MNSDGSYDAEAQRLAKVEKRKQEEHAAIERMQGFIVRSNNWRTCVNCENLKEIIKGNMGKISKYKHCSLYQAVPPPEVILHGCKEWRNDDIPF